MADSIWCPNECEKLTTARNKRVEFYDGDNEIEIEIRIEWCPVCKFVADVRED